MLFVDDTGKSPTAFLTSPRRQSSWSWYDRLTQKIVLKRPFLSDTGEAWAVTFTVQVSWETELWLDMVILVGRWFSKGHSSVALGKCWLLFIHCLVLWETVLRVDGLVLQGLIFWKLPLWEYAVVCKDWFLIIFTLEGCCGLKYWFWTFHFGRVWWSCKDWYWVIFTLGGCGGLTDFQPFPL